MHSKSMNRRIGWRSLFLILVPALLANSGIAAQAEKQAAVGGRIAKHGVVVDFEARPVSGKQQELVEGQLAEVHFRISEEASGVPVSGITPGVWMDIGEVTEGRPESQQKSCKEKVALYLRGIVGIRPMIDLNSYYVVVMNQEPSLSIVDPLVSMVGKTSTLGVVPLRGAGADWAKSLDEKQLYVSMPKAGQLAVVETEDFKVISDIDVGIKPTRVALQPDGRYLWVGNNAPDAQASGVTVIDIETLQVVATIATGAGHHEIAFTTDSDYAFVSNRDAGTVSVIDVQRREKLTDLATGPMPISLAYSALAQALYVADGKAGTMTLVGGSDFKIMKRIALEPGLGPLGFTPDGRWALTVNPAVDAVYVVDVAGNELVHTIEVVGQPYQLAFSPAFAYIRSLGSESVSMINLTSLGEGQKPIVQKFQTGSIAPKHAGELPIASSFAFTGSEAMAFVVNPADNTTYVYMEGMNAPSSNYQVFGARARAVTVVDRSLREAEPGHYVSKVKIPASGRYDVAFLLDTPQILHCFSVQAGPNPLVQKNLAVPAIEYLLEDRRVNVADAVPLRFRVTDPATGQAKIGLKDVRILYFRTPGADRSEVFAEEEGDGVYRAHLPLRRAGAYYVYVGLRSERATYQDLPYFTLVAVEDVADSSQPVVEVKP